VLDVLLVFVAAELISVAVCVSRRATAPVNTAVQSLWVMARLDPADPIMLEP
jgi:hypothetical protein